MAKKSADISKGMIYDSKYLCNYLFKCLDFHCNALSVVILCKMTNNSSISIGLSHTFSTYCINMIYCVNDSISMFKQVNTANSIKVVLPKA